MSSFISPIEGKISLGNVDEYPMSYDLTGLDMYWEIFAGSKFEIKIPPGHRKFSMGQDLVLAQCVMLMFALVMNQSILRTRFFLDMI